MKTNFKLPTTLVITSEDGGVVAVLNVPAGLCDITPKLEQIINEHECSETSKIENKEVISHMEAVAFTADIVMDGDDEVRDYWIEATANYTIQSI